MPKASQAVRNSISCITSQTVDLWLQGRVSPAWESIDITWQMFLVLCNTHSVTAYEVRKPETLTFDWLSLLANSRMSVLASSHESVIDCCLHLLLQLPVYVPSEEEQKDSLLYAQNVREYMVSLLHSLFAQATLPVSCCNQPDHK